MLPGFGKGWNIYYDPPDGLHRVGLSGRDGAGDRSGAPHLSSGSPPGGSVCQHLRQAREPSAQSHPRTVPGARCRYSATAGCFRRRRGCVVLRPAARYHRQHGRLSAGIENRRAAFCRRPEGGRGHRGVHLQPDAQPGAEVHHRQEAGEAGGDAHQRRGKKALVVFTDGDDNSSMLNAAGAARQAIQSGVPIYVIAQGSGLKDAKLMKILEELAAGTGGLAFRLTKPDKIGEVFSEISRNLRHTYLLSWKLPEGAGKSWHAIRIAVAGAEDARIRARQGYWPE